MKKIISIFVIYMILILSVHFAQASNPNVSNNKKTNFDLPAENISIDKSKTLEIE